MNTSLYSQTPTITAIDNRGLTVRDIAYHRHPDSPDKTGERITRHQYDIRGLLAQSADPRLHDAGLTNFTYLTDLAGGVLRSQGADNGTTVVLNDAEGRPCITVSNISTAENGIEGRNQAVTRTWQYEDAAHLGRLLSITEQVTGEVARITERFVYAGNSVEEKALNLAGLCVKHYDTAGLMQTDSVALTGLPLSVTRRLLKDADNPDAVADWKGTDASVWNDLLDAETYTTLSTADATGVMLTTTDAKGNLQRVAYDMAGLLSGSWLTLKGGKEQTVVKSLTYSAAGQKLREEHGNDVVTTYTYEAETQRLTGIKTKRPAGHASGAKVLQDLRYEYDPVGNVLKISNDAEEPRFWRNQEVVPENTYAYDSLYQLVSATGREIAGAGQQGSSLPSVTVPLPTDGAAFTNYTRTYTYDTAGNLTQVRHSAPATNNRYTTDITISNHSNRGVLSTLASTPSGVNALFTAGGQQTKLLKQEQHLAWTPRNELLKVTPVTRNGGVDDWESYRYDGGSQRVLKVSMQETGGCKRIQRTLYLMGLELRTTTNGTKKTKNLQVICMGEAGRAQVRGLHWENEQPEKIRNNQVRYSYDNLTGSSSLELDEKGELISREDYYPYGGTAVWTARSQVEAENKTIRYSGKERDITGLYYYGYRYYQPWAGRWLSADPAGMVDGPNLFRMVRNNPVTLSDTDGCAPVVSSKSTDESQAVIPRGISHNSMALNANTHLMQRLFSGNTAGITPERAYQQNNYQGGRMSMMFAGSGHLSMCGSNSFGGSLSGVLLTSGTQGKKLYMHNDDSALGILTHSVDSTYVRNTNTAIGMYHISNFPGNSNSFIKMEGVRVNELNVVLRKNAINHLTQTSNRHASSEGVMWMTGGSIQHLNIVMDNGSANFSFNNMKIGKINVFAEGDNGKFLGIAGTSKSIVGMDVRRMEDATETSLQNVFFQSPMIEVKKNGNNTKLSQTRVDMSGNNIKIGDLLHTTKYSLMSMDGLHVNLGRH